MSFFTTKTQVVQIDEENSVTVRELTYGEMQSCVKIIVGPDGKATSEPDSDLMLQKGIESWDGSGFDDRPVNLENIRALPARVVTKVMQALGPLLSPTDEEKN